MEFFDRVPTYPGRVRLVPVSGQANTYDMVRADEPLVEGTPVNKALFEGIGNQITIMQQTVADALFAVTQRVEVGSLAVGSVFGLYENGVLVPYIKLVNGYANSGRVLAVRKDCIKSDIVFEPSKGEYDKSPLDAWLNGEYISLFDTATQSVLDTVNISIVTGAGIGTVARKAFLLSLYEYQMTSDTFRTIGEALKYFEVADRRIATLNGTPVPHWTRTNVIHTSRTAYITTDGGHLNGDASTFNAGIRPALTLPTTFEVTVSVPSPANTMATAEVI